MRICPSCSTENPDGARFCVSCGTSLVPACPVCGTERPDGARFCPSCGTPFAESDVPAGQERRLVTILFADVSGSTALGERLDPERLQEVMSTYFRSMREEIEAEGGSVEKFIGDAVMAAFGVPVAHEDDPARALRATLRMQRRLEDVNASLTERFGVTLQVRIGVNTGEVLAAIDAGPGEPMVTGDAVNVAARLEQTAEPGTIVVAERTARAARGFRFRELGERDLRGKEQPVPAVVLQEVAPERPERGVPGLRAPMVGRDQELAVLRTHYERSAVEGRPNLITIYGDPGVGKSRLTAEFLRDAERQRPRPTIVRGRCLPYGEGVTYWPLAEILKGLAGVRDTDAPETTLAKIVTLGSELLTGEVATEPRRATAALAYTVGVRDPEFTFDDVEPREIRTKMHAAWRSLFSALARRAPMIAVVEDIHWADAVLLDLLEELADRVVGRVLFVCPARPDLTNRRPGWGGGRRNVSSITLEPLTRDDAHMLVGLLLDVEDLPTALRSRILERAEGNPFFLEEIVRHLIDEGRIVRDGDRWRAVSHIEDIEIPDTVQGVLAARIDLLEPIEKRALQRAAVVGRVFWPGPVGRLLNGEREHVRQTIDRLEERELVRSQLTSSIAGEPEFIFKHVLTRDVAYETLPRRERGQAHAAVADWIEATAGERRGEFAELLAHHHEEAYRSELEVEVDLERTEGLRIRAYEALLAASDTTRRRFAIDAALRLAERALLVAVSPLERARALEQRGMCALNDYRGNLAWESHRDAADIRLEHVPDDTLAIAQVCAIAVETPMRWPGSMDTVPSEDEVRRYLDAGLERAPERSAERISLLTAAAFSAYAFAGQRPVTPEEVERCLRRGLDAADEALAIGRLDLASAALDGASGALVAIGDYGAESRIVDRRLKLVEQIDDPWETGDAVAMAAWGAVMIGNYQRAVDYGESRTTELLDAGAPGVAMHGLSWTATAELLLGNWNRVVDEVAPRVEGLLGDRADNPPYFTQNLIGSICLIHVLRGDPRAERYLGMMRRMLEPRGGTDVAYGGVRTWLAWSLLRRASVDEAGLLLEQADASHFRGHQPLLRRVQAEHMADAGDWERVPPFAEDARRYARETGLRALPFHLDLLEGRSAIARGDHGGAIERLERAAAGFSSLSARWDLAETELFLAEALDAAGRLDEARERLASATAVLDELGAVRELRRAAELSRRLN